MKSSYRRTTTNAPTSHHRLARDMATIPQMQSPTMTILITVPIPTLSLPICDVCSLASYMLSLF